MPPNIVHDKARLHTEIQAIWSVPVNRIFTETGLEFSGGKLEGRVDALSLVDFRILKQIADLEPVFNTALEHINRAYHSRLAIDPHGLADNRRVLISADFKGALGEIRADAGIIMSPDDEDDGEDDDDEEDDEERDQDVDQDVDQDEDQDGNQDEDQEEEERQTGGEDDVDTSRHVDRHRADPEPRKSGRLQKSESPSPQAEQPETQSPRESQPSKRMYTRRMNTQRPTDIVVEQKPSTQAKPRTAANGKGATKSTSGKGAISSNKAAAKPSSGAATSGGRVSKPGSAGKPKPRPKFPNLKRPVKDTLHLRAGRFRIGMSYHLDYAERVLEANAPDRDNNADPRTSGNGGYKCCGRIRGERLMYRMIEDRADFQHWQTYEKGAPSESTEKYSRPEVHGLLEDLHTIFSYRFHVDSNDFGKIHDMDVAEGQFIDRLQSASDDYWNELTRLGLAVDSDN